MTSFYRSKIERRDNPELFYQPLSKIFNKENLQFSDIVNFVACVPDSHSNPHWRSQYENLFHDNKQLVDYIGKFENSHQSLQDISEKTGINFTSLPIRNKTKKYQPFQDYYNSNTQKLIKARYNRDIIEFDYNFKSKSGS